jgi:hypothetical protein
MTVEDSTVPEPAPEATPQSAVPSDTPLILPPATAEILDSIELRSGYISSADTSMHGDTLDLGPAPAAVESFEVRGDYVVAIMTDGTLQPIEVDTAMQRCVSIRESLRSDDGSTPWPILDRRAWLLIETVKCVGIILKKNQINFDPRGIEIFIKSVDAEVKRARSRNFGRE